MCRSRASPRSGAPFAHAATYRHAILHTLRICDAVTLTNNETAIAVSTRDRTGMAPPCRFFAAPACAVVSLAAPPHQVKGERSAGRRGVLARHPLRACEARGRRLRGVFTSLAIGTSRLSALHRGICRLGPWPTTPARLGKSQSRRKPPPAPPNGTVSGRRPSMSRDACDYHPS